MLYISGIHALNLNCSCEVGLETCGDWHQSGIQWENIKLWESDGSIFENYGIELNKHIPEHDELYNVANHIRALLDLLQVVNFSTAQGMREDYICNEKLTYEVFEKVLQLKQCDNWNEIDKFMYREYGADWTDFKMEGCHDKKS